MKVKKVVTSILAMLVAGSVIAGCGGSGGDKKWFYNLFWGAKVTVQMRVLSAPTFFSIKK